MGKSKLEQHAQEIVPGLWLGGQWACRYAREAGFRTICVLETPCAIEDCFHAPIFVIDTSARCDTHLLKKANQAIDKLFKTGPVLVHCLAGCERSPLVVASWLCKRHGLALGEAYNIITSKRPIVEKRDVWLTDAERDRYERRPSR
jgi:hypothetical protein